MATTTTPAELILYPGADHHFLERGKPSHRTDANNRILQWLERYIGAAETGKSSHTQ